MASPTNLRKSPRFPLVVPIQVTWKDTQGLEWRRQGYCLDTSSGGLKMELPSPVPVNACIQVRSAQLHFAGSASVRHCRRDGPRYLVGVAFRTVASEVLRPEPPPERRVPDDEPESDDIRPFFQELHARKMKQVALRRSRHKAWRRVALIVWATVSVLFVLSFPRLLRFASETYPHPLLERASAFVETITEHGPSMQ